jgi:hypothetical protein
MTSVYLQHDNEKPVKVPVRKPEAMPDAEVVIKNKTYRILSLDFEPIIEIFWEKKKREEGPKPEATSKTNSRDKIRKNLQIFKETGVYPKD